MDFLKLLHLVIHQVQKRGIIAVIQKICQIVKENKYSSIFPKKSHVLPTSIKGVLCSTWVLAANDITWASNDYRGLNFNYAFQKLGIPTTFVDHFSFYSDRDLQASALGVVLFRTDSFKCEYSGIRRNIPIVYDTDDLCFDRRFFTKENVPGILSTTSANQEWLLGGSLDGQEDILKHATVGTGPTRRITQSMRELGTAKVMLIDNVLPAWMAEQSRSLRRISSKQKKDFQIVYASGSNTHSRDFAVAWQGIQKFLSQTPTAILTILGYSPISKSNVPNSLKHQVNFRAQVPHKRLLEEHSKYDLAIAPLEQNEFTNGKSALKFVHAASLGIPCLASPTEPFITALADRFHNLLVSDEDWYKKLTQVFFAIDESNLREELIEEFELNWTIKNLIEQIRKLVSEI